jgi:hydrogenase maturation protein HypF
MAEATPTPSPSAASLARWRLTVRGVVQGVGFRPFVYRLAQQYRLSGHVGNDTAGVFIEVQGQPEQLAAFRAELLRQPPPLAQIDTHTCEAITPHPDERDFRILESGSRAGPTTAVPADIATCPDCLRELHDPADRRYRYPFINCTHCGPRFTIIRSLPYDRPTTTMASFALCPACAREYHDPADRRFHAQPVACPVCGPHLSLVDAAGQTVAARDEALREAAARLAAGQVVAVKGIGGFHLACDATNPTAVATLRARKGRGEKPFAVMVRDLAQARAYAQIDAHEERLLVGAERPIVLVRRLDHQPGDATAPARALADAVAPGTDTLGLFLPYSPLHHLLLAEPALGGVPLVMTSGNRSDEPIARDNDEALTRLAGLADAWLLHNRDIHTVCDDSVVRVLLEREYPLRRSRGYVPLPVRLPRAVPPVLAVGGELKATLCVTTGDYAILSQHIGDVESPETLAALDRTAAHLLRLFSVEPTRIVCDAHPGYLSAHWAQRWAATRGVPLVRVQHHHAHVASLVLDAAWTAGPVLGVCFDGTGYGEDGSIWGGEFLLVDGPTVRRLAHLKPVPLPGGDASIRRPYRQALAHLWAAGVPWDSALPCVAACPPAEARVLAQQLPRGIGCVPTSSMGRLFDAVAALVGLRPIVTYEAQAAMELEALAARQLAGACDGDGDEAYRFAWTADARGPLVVDAGPVVAAVAADVCAAVPAARVAARFHAAVVQMIVEVVRQLVVRERVAAVGLTGGVFQNVLLTEWVSQRLRDGGVHVLTHRAVPCNDGGLALGQAGVASGALAANSRPE